MLAQPLARGFMAFNSYEDTALDANSGHDAGRRFQEPTLPRPYAKGVGSYSAALTYAQHELLRQRKTPQGRQLETLDIANIDESLQLPAPKHVLLSISPNGQDPGATDFGGRQQLGRQPPSRMAVAGLGYDTSSRQLSNTPRYGPGWSLPGAFDSTLTQNVPLANNQRAYYAARSQIPTVLPTALQPTYNPTASAGQQYYGPYWPDGTFSPYRPTPVRDDRFFHYRHSRDVSRFSTSDAIGQDATHYRPPYDGADYRFQHAQPATVQGVRTVQSLPPCDAYAPYPSFHDRISSALDVSNPSYGSNYNQPQFAAPYENVTQDYPATPDDYTLRPTPASERITYRDRTFSWAYKVYLELLAQISRESKLTKQQAGASGPGRPPGKPAIFPRPPQRSVSHFSDSCVPTTGKYVSQDIGKIDGVRVPENSDLSSRPSTAIRTPRRASDFAVTANRMRQYNSGSYANSTAKLNDMGGQQLDLRYSLHDTQNAYQSTANAVSALDSVEALCHEADVAWLDGMLLAGCLAYGIGNYGRALAWYQKVLREDPRHVEAMSNLAATMLALGRREEAAKQWSAAVKLRPSFFEAVEHLVGLFVSSHRTREAVDTIEYIESCLKLPAQPQGINGIEDDSDTQSRASSTTISSAEGPYYEFEIDRRWSKSSTTSDRMQGFGIFGYAISAVDSGRLLALIHAKGNMLYSLGNNRGAALAFEDAILVATGEGRSGIKGLIDKILRSCISEVDPFTAAKLAESKEPILLSPERAQQISQRMFPPSGDLPGLEFVPTTIAHRAAISTTSNSLLSLAKIYQDGLCNQSAGRNSSNPGTREILALYYLSLSLQPSPSTANNVGILLAGIQSTSTIQVLPQQTQNRVFNYTGVAPGSGVALALAYYNYGLNLDGKHAHLYTNLGSLLKDLGELQAAIKMYETAVSCDGTFDIALANLANAVKDQGRIAEAIKFYKRAVQANPDFAEAVCGLATALNSVCDWYGRGGVYAEEGRRDRIHVDDKGMMHEARKGSGWMNKVVEIVDKQLRDGECWGIGTLTPEVVELMCRQLIVIKSDTSRDRQTQLYRKIQESLQTWAGRKWEGSRLVRLVERAIKRIGWQWYQDRYVHGKEYPSRRYARPLLPITVPVPSAPTVLPFHTFTTPLSAKQVRQISQRNALRISVSTLKSAWLPRTVYPPPAPPSPCLRVGYVSSDFNNHPLAHLMQSVFGLHNPKNVRAYCYATTASDGSIHRQQIEREAPVFHDASCWKVDKLVNRIVEDGIHILVNLNGYTRGAKNEVFAARPAPIHMSFMGFAGTLGAEWCDYVYADDISVSRSTLAPYRYNTDIEDKLNPKSQVEDAEDWIYAENVIFSKSTFFCVDHKQSAPDAQHQPPPLHNKQLREQAWREEQKRRWKLRKEVFPTLKDDAIILGNFNQLYKIDPSTFRMYLRILNAVPNAILWLLRFPDVGEQNLMSFAKDWAGPETASRIIFTDVAPKGAHITRASVVDLFLDTPDCNAHTTAADVIWSGTPIVTWARWEYKMCSRMASSIVASALPEGPEGDEGRRELLVRSEQEYEDHAIHLARNLRYNAGSIEHPASGRGLGRLMDLRRILWEGRWTSRLFDTKRWVRDLEKAYWVAWEKWEAGEGGDIWL